MRLALVRFARRFHAAGCVDDLIHCLFCEVNKILFISLPTMFRFFCRFVWPVIELKW